MPIFLLTESLHDRFNEQKPIKGGGTKKLPKDQLLRSHRCPPRLCPPPHRPPPAPPAPRALGLSATLPIVLIYWESRRRSAAATRLPRGDPSWEAGATAHPGLLGTSLDSGSGAALPHPPQQGPHHSSGTRTGKTDFQQRFTEGAAQDSGGPLAWPLPHTPRAPGRASGPAGPSARNLASLALPEPSTVPGGPGEGPGVGGIWPQ